MEQGDLSSFTSIVASLLLCKRCITSDEIINFISKLNCDGFEIDEDWSIDELALCVNMDSQYSFILKDGLSYDSILFGNMTVRKFLEGYSNEKVMKEIREDQHFGSFYSKSCQDYDKEARQLDDSSLIFKKECFWKIRGKDAVVRARRMRPWYSFLGGVH